mgnify:FL=1
MTELPLSTPSILFSAISLILLAYTNRFLSYAQVVRNLKADHDKNPSAITRLQLANLRRRLYMARQMQLFGVSSLLLCVVCTFLIYIGLQMAAVYTFGVALVLLVISLGISIRELLISVKALEIHLDTLERMKTLTATTGREGDIETGRRRTASASGNSRSTSASGSNRANRGNSTGKETAKEQSSGKNAAASGSDRTRSGRNTKKQDPEKSTPDQTPGHTGAGRKGADKPTPASPEHASVSTDTADETRNAEGATTRSRSRGGRRRGGRGRGTAAAETGAETTETTGNNDTAVNTDAGAGSAQPATPALASSPSITEA